MLNMCQISSVMAAAVAEFSGFANFEEKKRKSNLLMSFPKIVNPMGSFGQKRKKNIFRFCRPILDIFGFTLLIIILCLLGYLFSSCKVKCAQTGCWWKRILDHCIFSPRREYLISTCQFLQAIHVWFIVNMFIYSILNT